MPPDAGCAGSGADLLASFLLQILALAAPGMMAVIVDKVVPRGDQQLLYLVGSGFVTLASFYFLSNLLRARVLLELRTKIEARMSFDFVEHLFALPYGFYQQRTTGDLLMRLSSQTAIRELLTTGALSALLDGALVTLYFVLLIGAAPMLALVALGFAALQALTYLLASRRKTTHGRGLAAPSASRPTGRDALRNGDPEAMGATERAMSRWSDLYSTRSTARRARPARALPVAARQASLLRVRSA